MPAIEFPKTIQEKKRLRGFFQASCGIELFFAFPSGKNP